VRVGAQGAVETQDRVVDIEEDVHVRVGPPTSAVTLYAIVCRELCSLPSLPAWTKQIGQQALQA
jgi:hypothetical protein